MSRGIIFNLLDRSLVCVVEILTEQLFKINGRCRLRQMAREMIL